MYSTIIASKFKSYVNGMSHPAHEAYFVE